MKSTFLLIVGLVALVINLSAKIAREDEIYLPFQAKLTQSFLPNNDSSKELQAGERFIILRPVDDGLLLAEFPRKGTYKISPSITDVNDLIIDAKKSMEKENAVLTSRMNYFLANRIISGETGWKYTLQEAELREVTRWILIYGDSAEKSTIKAIKLADAYYVSLSDKEREKLALVYLDPTGNKTNIQSIADTLKPNIQSMPGYLSRGYSKSFAHLNDVEKFPFLVELETSGRIVSKHEGFRKIKTFFKKR